MSNYKLVPVEPAPKMLQVWKSMYGYSRYDKYKAMLAEAPVINIVATKNEQGQIVSVTLQDADHRILEVIAEADVPVASAPVAAQQRFRHPQKSAQGWSPWQPAAIRLDRPSWEIDSQGYEVEYRLLYAAPQPAKQSTFTVGTDLSDGKLMVVVMKHENDNSWVIHTEVIQLAEQQREPCHECGGNGAGGEHEEDCSQQPATEVERHLVETLLQQYETNRHLTIGRWIEHGPFAKLFATYPKQRGEA